MSRNKHIVDQNEETNEYFSKKNKKNLRKITKQNWISNVSDKEFKLIVIHLLTKLRKRMGEVSENFNKEIENTNKNQA